MYISMYVPFCHVMYVCFICIMYAYICIYLFICIFVCVYIYVCASVCIYACVYICVGTHFFSINVIYLIVCLVNI